jgi:Flp pilus assembly protein TadD
LAHVGVGITKLETPPMFGGSIDEALAEFRLAQRLDERCDEAWVWEGIALRRRGDSTAARRAFGHALSIDPRNGHARRELAALDAES